MQYKQVIPVCRLDGHGSCTCRLDSACLSFQLNMHACMHLNSNQPRCKGISMAERSGAHLVGSAQYTSDLNNSSNSSAWLHTVI